jgi:hypothetical protein
LDDQAAELYRRGRRDGLNIKAIKEVIRTMRGDPGDADSIWAAYASKLGIDTADIAADGDSKLDQIPAGQI